VQHGDGTSGALVQGMPPDTRERLFSLAEARVDTKRCVAICHSEPGAWHPPRWPTSQCPPQYPTRAAYEVGRTMFETDRIPDGWSTRLNQMDEIWVPSKWAVDVFHRGGVERSKLVQVPEAVDTTNFNPEGATPLKLRNRRKFALLSIFKWEERKAWDVLLKAFFEEFTAQDEVSLHLLTHGYHDDSQKTSKPLEYARSLGLAPADLPMVDVIDRHISDKELVSLYRAADAFVLPSRGEGWGRPHVEAMAMGLPIIATNWSGTTEFMNDRNSYPLPIDGLTPVKSGAFKGHLWAEPSHAHLKRLMRHVVTHPDEAKQKGARARRDMVEQYSPDAVANVVLQRLAHIEALLHKRVR